MYRDEELMEDVMGAVFRGDLDAARHGLDMLKFAGNSRQRAMVQRARRTAEPIRSGAVCPLPDEFPVAARAARGGKG